MKPTSLFVSFTLAAIAAATLSASQTREVVQPFGPASAGLRLGLRQTAPVPPQTGPAFIATFENVGNRDFSVNLGWMLANGDAMYPLAVKLLLTDSSKQTRELQIPSPRVAGRVDDLIVSLPKGATYALRLSLDQYTTAAAPEFRVNPAPGRHRIAARFEGRGAQRLNSDTKGVGLLKFWTGRVESNAIEIEVGAWDSLHR
jgi:hypothetical protein